MQLNNFAVAFYVPSMFETLEWGTYIFFAVFLGSSIVWVWFCLVSSRSLFHGYFTGQSLTARQPETKGATLEEMDQVFKSRTGQADADMLEQARRDVGIDHDLEVDAIRAAGHGNKEVTKTHVESA